MPLPTLPSIRRRLQEGTTTLRLLCSKDSHHNRKHVATIMLGVRLPKYTEVPPCSHLQPANATRVAREIGDIVYATFIGDNNTAAVDQVCDLIVGVHSG